MLSLVRHFSAKVEWSDVGGMCHGKSNHTQIYYEPASVQADFGGGDIVYDVVIVLIEND